MFLPTTDFKQVPSSLNLCHTELFNNIGKGFHYVAFTMELCQSSVRGRVINANKQLHKEVTDCLFQAESPVTRCRHLIAESWMQF